MLTDPLTGVYSRATLEQRLHEEIERARRYDLPFSMIMLDLDHYKSVNDAFGHTRGDQVLAEFAPRILSSIRKSDIVFRYGGDEFLLLLPNTTKSQAAYLALRVLDDIRSHPFHGKPPLSLSISLGVASFPDDADSPQALFEKADQRHYEAKRRGRGRVVSEDPPKAAPLPFDDGSRLIERETALLTLHHFLHDLPQYRRGVFAVTGPPGSGRSRFLAEVNKVARLLGYEVIALQGSPALKSRSFGDLGDVCNNWPILPPPSAGKEAFAQALQLLVEEKGRSGVVFSVANLPEVDWPTIELLHGLLAGPHPEQLCLVYTADPASTRRFFQGLTPLSQTVEVGALTREGFHIWVRTLLRWEAPPDFEDWLYTQTSGLPSFAQTALADLVDRHILEKTEEGWAIESRFAGLALKERLGFESGRNIHLPSAPTTFIGRQAEIGMAKEMLESGRLLTIAGPGGVGKTRLALQTAGEIYERFPDGVYWVPLASTRPASLISAIATALQFNFYTHEDPESLLSSFLQTRSALLVLDNFEHLVPAAGLLARLLAAAPRLRLLVTSRQRLNLREERILELKGMNIPRDGDLGPLETYSAIQLFIQSARRADPHFVLKESDRQPVTRICQFMEGLPLGIELAAAWVRVLDCHEILAELERNLDFLQTPLHDVPDRHRTLRAVFEHSWDLLLEDEKEALRRAAVFTGSFTREAALQVANASLWHLTALLDKTLLRKTASGRYEMHELVRQYAHEKMHVFQEEDADVHDRHAVFFAGLVQGAAARLHGEGQKQSLETIAKEIENIRAAWSWATQQCRFDLIAQLLDGLSYFYEVRGLFQEGSDLFQQVESVILAQIDPDGVGEAEGQHLLARILFQRGRFCHRLTRYEEARALLMRSLEISREAGLVSLIAGNLLALCKLETELGEHAAARAYCQESLALYRRLEDRGGLGDTLNELGSIAYQMGEYQAAEHYHQDSLRLFREVNDRRNLALTLRKLGNIEAELGDYFQAMQLYQESLGLCEEVGAQTDLAATLNNLGVTACEIHQYDQARQFLRRSFEIATGIGDRYGMTVALDNLSEVASMAGAHVEARQLLAESLQISDETGNRLGRAYSLALLGNVTRALGEHPAARQHYQEALQIAFRNSALPLAMQILVGYAALLRQTGQQRRALQLLAFALNHPATMKATRDQADRLRLALQDELPPHLVREIERSSPLRPVEEVVQEIQMDTGDGGFLSGGDQVI